MTDCFREYVDAHVQVEMDCFLVASKEMQNNHMSERAAKHGLFGIDPSTVAHECLLSKCEAEHVTEIVGQANRRRGVQGCFVADVSQSPKYTVRGWGVLSKADDKHFACEYLSGWPPPLHFAGRGSSSAWLP